jgi:hypothetical protein
MERHGTEEGRGFSGDPSSRIQKLDFPIKVPPEDGS